MDPDTRNKRVDTTFGIRYENPTGWMIGNKENEIEGDDIIIDGEMYVGTPGLWSLIASKIPNSYNEEDLERYKELLYETSALHQHYDSRDQYPRASGSKKWKQILAPIWNEFQFTGAVASRNAEDDLDSLDGTLVNEHNDSDSDESASTSNGNELTEGDGIKMFLQKHGRCFALQKCGNGLKFTPRPKLAGIGGDGLYLRAGSRAYEGQGLILGANSPFKNIAILGWLL